MADVNPFEQGAPSLWKQIVEDNEFLVQQLEKSNLANTQIVLDARKRLEGLKAKLAPK